MNNITKKVTWAYKKCESTQFHFLRAGWDMLLFLLHTSLTFARWIWVFHQRMPIPGTPKNLMTEYVIYFLVFPCCKVLLQFILYCKLKMFFFFIFHHSCENVCMHQWISITQSNKKKSGFLYLFNGRQVDENCSHKIKRLMVSNDGDKYRREW